MQTQDDGPRLANPRLANPLEAQVSRCLCLPQGIKPKLLTMKFYCKTEIPDWEHKAKLANYRVKEFARLVGMSKTTLQRFFREHVGKTAKQWLLETQMVHGFLLLAEGHSAKVT